MRLRLKKMTRHCYTLQSHEIKHTRSDALLEFKLHDVEVSESRFKLCGSYQEACDGAHAIVILTEWDEFQTYNYAELYEKMQKPAFVFDGRNLLNHTQLAEIGFEVHAIGKSRRYTTSTRRSYTMEDNSGPYQI